MGFFDRKSPEEKEREKIIKKILGGITWTPEVGKLFKKYNRGGTQEQKAWNQTKKEAKENKIQPQEYLSRLEELLSQLADKDDVKNKLSEEHRDKINELTGGFVLSPDFVNSVKLCSEDLDPITIQSQLKNLVIVENISVDGIEDKLNEILNGNYYGYKESLQKNNTEVNKSGSEVELSDEQKNKISELTGGFFLSTEFINIVKMESEDLNAIDIKNELKNVVKAENISVDGIEDKLNEILNGNYYKHREYYFRSNDSFKDVELSDDQETVIMELTGGFFSSAEFINIVKMESEDLNLSHVKNQLKNAVKIDDIPPEKIEDKLNEILNGNYYKHKETLHKNKLKEKFGVKKGSELEEKGGVKVLEKLLNQGLAIQGRIYEDTGGYYRRGRYHNSGISYSCVAVLEEDKIEIFRRSLWTGSDRGSKKVMYSDMVSADYKSPSFGSAESIKIFLSGMHFSLSFIEPHGKKFYDNLIKEIDESRDELIKPTVVSNELSAADEIAKFHDLKEKGIITEEEFENKKRDLLI